MEFNLGQSIKFFNQHVESLRSLCSEPNGLLSKNSMGSRGWSNIILHSMTSGVCTKALCSLLGMSEEDTIKLTDFMIVHDSQKRLQIDKGFARSMNYPDRASYLNNIDPDATFSKACGPEYIAEGIYSHASLGQQIAHYVDNLCLGGTLTYPQLRLKEVRSRRKDLSTEYWKREAEVTRTEEANFSNILKSRGIKFEPDKLPSLIISEISGRGRNFLVACEGINHDYLEAYGPYFHTEWITATPKASLKLNEDFVAVRVTDNFIRGVVIDGASAISSFTGSESPGRQCARLAAEFISELPLDTDPLKCLELANKNLESSGSNQVAGRVSASSCALVFTVERNFCETDSKERFVKIKYASLGDCDLAIKTKSDDWKWLNYGAGKDIELGEISAAVMEAQNRGCSIKDVLANLEQFPITNSVINSSRTKENASDGSGTGALKGDPWESVFPYINHGELVIDEGEFVELVSFTDGAILPVTVPDQVRKENLENLLSTSGISGAVKARFLQGDTNKDCSFPPCLKNKDDIGIIRVRGC